ncbi:MAG TPA: hypothetical protein VK753_06875 [Xanthomonadaceae bacterium]|jgi:hypothetical protein|nr:hypothetical protein [Xanthomonadaceae bacterium]
MRKPSHMRFRTSILVHAMAIVLLSSASLVASAGSNDDVHDFKTVVQKRGDTAVPVKFVMTVSGAGSEQQQEGQTQGTLVSADGLILVPGRVVSLDLGALSRGSGIGSMGGGSVPSAKSGQFRVRLAGSDEWQPADLVTRDTELGVAWLRLRHPGGKLPYVDFKDAAKVDIGMELFTVMRTSDQFGSVPIVRAGYVLGETNVPRHIWLIDGSPGVAFDGEGNPAGFVDVDLAGMVRSRNASGSIGMDMGDAEFTMIPADRIGRVTAEAAVLPIVKPAEGDSDEAMPSAPLERKHGTTAPEPAPAHPASPGDDQPKPETAQPDTAPAKKSTGG